MKQGTTWRLVAVMGFALFVIRAAGCDYNITSNPDKSLVVTSISPQAVTLAPGASITFTSSVAHFQNDSSLTWSLSNPNVGQLQITGGMAIYTAPASVSGAATSVSVLVQSREDPTKTAQAVITIVNSDTSSATGTKILLTPVAITLEPARSQQFQASIAGASGSVTWRLVSGYGIVSSTGLYTAPTAAPSLPSFGIIRATSTVDPTKFADATITVANSNDSLICFERDILPVLVGNCGTSGCHTASDGPGDLTHYQGTLKYLTPGLARSSRLYLAPTDFDISKRMPPPPRPMLSPPQIIALGRWIDQGAQNTACSNASDCDTSSVHYSGFIQTTMNTYCVGCHQGASAGGGIDLSNYSGLGAQAASGKLMGSITFAAGFSAMPKGGPRLDDCTIAKIQAWVNRGYPND